MTDTAQALIAAFRVLHERNMLASFDGNISLRQTDQRVLISPSGVSKQDLQPQDLAVMSPQGEVIEGKPSSEALMHLSIYETCPQAKAIVHAHPPYAIAWSLAYPDSTELPADCVPEVILAAGRIPIVPYARPGTQAMGDQLKPFLPDCRLLILARHGALSWGENLAEAVRGMERLEHSAQILFTAYLANKPQALPESEVKALRELRHKLGDQTL